MNKKVVTAHLPAPVLVSDTLPSRKKALKLVVKADMFLTTAHGEAMDTNHRGGPPEYQRS